MTDLLCFYLNFSISFCKNLKTKSLKFQACDLPKSVFWMPCGQIRTHFSLFSLDFYKKKLKNEVILLILIRITRKLSKSYE